MLIFFVFWATTGNTQWLLLGLHSGIIGLGDHMGFWYSNCVGHIEGKCFTHCAMALAPKVPISEMQKSKLDQDIKKKQFSPKVRKFLYKSNNIIMVSRE